MFKNKRIKEMEESIELLHEQTSELVDGFGAMAEALAALRESVAALNQHITTIEQSDKQVSIARRPEGLEVSLIDRSMPLEKLISVAESILNRNQPKRPDIPESNYG